MTRSLAAAFLFLFGLVQLPFTFVGVSMAVGYALDGPSYFYELHRTLAGAGAPTETQAETELSPRLSGLEPGIAPDADGGVERYAGSPVRQSPGTLDSAGATGVSAAVAGQRAQDL